jgi:hypothetical protein
MTHKPAKKTPIYSEINELLGEYGESVIMAAQNPLFRQRVTQEILDLFSPTNVSAFTLETTRAILESFEKGAIDIQDIYLLREFVVEWQQQVIEQEENLSLHETISFILKSGNVGESIADASKKLLGQGKVDELAVSSYK